MKNFVFHNPTKVVFGKGSIAAVAEHIPQGAKVLVTYGGGSIKANGVYQQITDALTGIDWQEFGGIQANPEYDTLMEAVALVKQQKINYLLAVGGGSVIDGSKFIAAAVNFDGVPWNILAKQAKVESALPLGCVLTLPATGSETNTAAVITRKQDTKKLSFMSDEVRPLFAILDPEVTYSLPQQQLANGVVDAFVHVIEQYLTYPVNASVQDRFAESILQNLLDIGPKVFDPGDYQTRANLMWNASQALNGLIGMGVPHDWSTHMIGHELTALYQLDHAVTLAIVLPSLLRHRKEAKREKLLQYAQRVWHLDIEQPDVAIAEAINKTEAFFRTMGMKTRLSEHQIDQKAVRLVPRKLMENGLFKLGERGDMTPKDAEIIIANAL